MEEAHKQGVISPNDDVNNATPAQKDWVKKRVDQLVQSGQGSEADMTGYFTRKPLKGQESFRKQKVFDDIMTGAEFGLRPISHNPIDLVKGKLAEMDKSIMANEFFRQLREEGHLKIISPYEEVPEGWVKLNDKYGTIYGPPTVKVPEWVDKNVYEGLLGFAKSLGITHARTMKFPRGPGKVPWACPTKARTLYGPNSPPKPVCLRTRLATSWTTATTSGKRLFRTRWAWAKKARKPKRSHRNNAP